MAHAGRHVANAGVASVKRRGITHPGSGREWSGKGGAQRRAARNAVEEAWGDLLTRARGSALSVLGTCVTKQTKDMVYSEARRVRVRGTCTDNDVVCLGKRVGYWINRYNETGPEGFVDRSRRSHGCSHATLEPIENAILVLHAKHPSWGARKLRARLECCNRRWSGPQRVRSATF